MNMNYILLSFLTYYKIICIIYATICGWSCIFVNNAFLKCCRFIKSNFQVPKFSELLLRFGFKVPKIFSAGILKCDQRIEAIFNNTTFLIFFIFDAAYIFTKKDYTIYMYTRWPCHASLWHSVVACMRNISVAENYGFDTIMCDYFYGSPFPKTHLCGC